jgi:hypothetical protein
MGYLHIGSRICLEDMDKACSGHHSLVEPYFASMDRKDLKSLKKDYPCFEFSSKTAHAFLEEKIAEGVTYTTIRIDAPYVGIIDESSDFGLLCRQMKPVLSKHGKIVILTDYKPDRVGVVHKFSDDDAKRMYGLLAGREMWQLSAEEMERLSDSVTKEKTANMVGELKSAGFKVRYFPAPESAIKRSESASRRAARGKKIYMVVATK